MTSSGPFPPKLFFSSLDMVLIIADVTQLRRAGSTWEGRVNHTVLLTKERYALRFPCGIYDKCHAMAVRAARQHKRSDGRSIASRMVKKETAGSLDGW